MIESVTIPACECGHDTWTLTDDTANATGTDPFYWRMWLLTCTACGAEKRLGLKAVPPDLTPLSIPVLRGTYHD